MPLVMATCKGELCHTWFDKRGDNLGTYLTGTLL